MLRLCLVGWLVGRHGTEEHTDRAPTPTTQPRAGRREPMDDARFDFGTERLDEAPIGFCGRGENFLPSL